MGSESFLEMRGITKAFPGVTALDNVNFSCKSGKIHALLGENGAGKSTLMNLLGGLYKPDSGQIVIDGNTVEIPDPRAADRLKIGFVHQEANLLTNLTVAENIFLTREPLGAMGLPDRARMAKRIQEINDQMGYHLDPGARISDLKLADRQLAEIARAVQANPKILIMDEPTAALNADEVERLFDIIETLRDQGVAIIYISHRLEEIIRVADCVTVLKDGKNAGSLPKEEITRDKMISMMIGRVLTDIYPDRSAIQPGETLLEVRDLSIAGKVHGASFSVRAGEIVGFGGLDGQGQREVARAVFGDIPFTGGTVKGNGAELRSGDIRSRVRHHLGYVTNDRRGDGLILHQSVRKNASIAALDRFKTRVGSLSKRRENKEVAEQIRRMQVKISSLDQTVGTLSGGNQQKVMLARWLMVQPNVLLIDEPTKGVDVGARMSVYEIIHQLTLDGIGVVILTSDMLELIGLSDRILVFYEGEITGEIARKDATEERLMQAASGIAPEGGAAE